MLLLMAASITPFWCWLHRELGLDEHTVLRPETTTAIGRPDLTAYRMDGHAIAIIECENWGEDKNQSSNYARSGLPVYLILGTDEKPQQGTTWARIQQAISSIQNKAEPRQRVILELLDQAINDILVLKPRRKPHRLAGAELPEWLKAATTPLFDVGEAVVISHAFAEGSASVRLAGPSWAFRNKPRHGVFIAMSRHSTPTTIYLAGPKHLKRHLADGLEAWVTGKWSDTLRSLTDGILGEDGSGRVAIDTNTGQKNSVDVVGAALSELVRVLRAGPR